MTLLTTAYAGSADIKAENLDALLNQILPDGPLGMVYIPDGTIVKRNQPGLAKVVDWLQHNENGVGVEGTIPVPNLIGAMLERNIKLAEDGEDKDELVLVMAYNPASGLDVSLVKEAHGAGIRVVDLNAAGDDIVPPEPEAPAEEEPTEPTPPPAEDTPPWEGEAEPADLAAEHAAPTSEAGKAVARATRAAKAAAAKHDVTEAMKQAKADADEALAAVQEAVHQLPPPPGTPGITFQIQLNIAPEHVATLAQAIVAAMGAQAQAIVTPVTEPVAQVIPIGNAGTNKADPAGQPEGTKPFYYNATEGKYRPARGVKRKGEDRVFLTDAEVEEAKAAKMLS